MTKEEFLAIVDQHQWSSKLPADVKAEWLAALRGPYEQARNNLREWSTDKDKHCFCCLGVLADLRMKAGVVDWKWSDHAITYPSQDEDDIGWDNDQLPAGNGLLSEDDMTFLANMNDGSGPFHRYQNETFLTTDRYQATFAEIADVIERYL